MATPDIQFSPSIKAAIANAQPAALLRSVSANGGQQADAVHRGQCTDAEAAKIEAESLCWSPSQSPSQALGFVSSPQRSGYQFSYDSSRDDTEEACWNKDSPGLMTIAECLHPLLELIGGFLIDSPQDVGRVFHTTSRCLAQQASFASDVLWHDIYAYRWKPFSRLLDFYCERDGKKDWRLLYRDTVEGKIEFTMEVFDRQKKAGFAMSAMPARIYYERREKSFVAWYMSASQVPPELIPESQQYRLRACPRPALEHLCFSSNFVSEVPLERRWSESCKKRSQWVGRSQDIPEVVEKESYPYSCFGKTDGLKVGEPVELQWKMQGLSPFGWWFGLLESLSRQDDLTTATIIFPHFSPASQWYRLTVCVGDSEIRDCALGGKSGGLRPVSADERLQWMRHFPMNPIQDP